jgi:hypothetical protein
MKKAQRVIKMCEESEGSPINLDALKAGDWVMFGKGHAQAGNRAIVHTTHKDRGTIDCFVGKALQADVPAGDMVKIDNPGAPQGQPAAAGNGGEAPAAAATGT